jgi:drug/metabolite transporter (DMT)-like permease
MKISREARRVIAAILIVLGGVLMFAAPDTIGKRETFNGFALIVLGIVIEAIGMVLERRS